MAKNILQINKETPSQHLPPQNLEAEESILSAILLDNSSLVDVLDILRADDFYRSAHQTIFSAVIDLFSKNEPIDLITLSNILRKQKKLDEIGGATYLAKLVDTVPLAVNAQHYAKIVHEKAYLRRLIEKANEITKRCFEDSEDVDEVIDFAERSIFEISGDKIGPSFHSISQIIEKSIDTLEKRQRNKSLVTGVPTGFKKLDTDTSGLQKSDLIIIAARPGMGKTAFALNIARNAAIESNIPVSVFSLEMSKEQLAMRLLSSEAKVNSTRIRGGFLNQDDWHQINNAAGRLYEAPIYIDDSPSLTALELRAKARRMKMEKDIGIIIIDYLQLMKIRGMAERRDLEISEISRSLKALAKELDIPVVALSQLNRKLEERSDKRPQLSDLRESGALEQDSDVVMFIYRDDEYNKDESNPKKGTAEILLKKQRNGPTGMSTLTFLADCTCFENYTGE
ncbi:MAG: replicative DNA helicase [Deltaproteobacteria bacterium]|nr:replicative DNA helicase [Deltaproteobacteria bacterium]MBW1847228.1 replicative DNA helicase [Deltaproteobacteria bacterium]MBW2180178.1 replicative DNA helicase [Deltaproteobacteria bacterium]MBW2363778.1 replicative DNA helicase [Deltaproteobacteria bacterium]